MVSSLAVAISDVALDPAARHLDCEHYPHLRHVALAHTWASVGVPSWLGNAAGVRMRGADRCNHPVAPVHSIGRSTVLNRLAALGLDYATKVLLTYPLHLEGPASSSQHPFVESTIPRLPKKEDTVTQTSTIQTGSKQADNKNAIRPFQVNVPEAELTELRRRIKATKWPERETVADASQGVQLATIQALARYWETD